VPLLSVADLLTVTTQADALALELTICTAFGLPTTAWQALSPEMAILGTNSQIVATYSATVNQIAQGGFASSAATIPGVGALVDGNGFTTTWMDLCSVNFYNVNRVPATFANGLVPVNNTGAISYPFGVGQLHFQNAITGATYSNTTTGTILAGAVNFNINVQADAPFPGNSGTTPAGQTLVLLTPLSGVTPQPLVVSLIGNNVETNAALLTRCFAKLGSLSPNGAAQAYVYVATTIPTAATQSTATFPFNVLPYTVSAPITRVATALNPVTGSVGVYVANASGAPPGGDVTTVFNAIQNLSTPLSVTVTVSPVGTVPLNLLFNVFVLASSGLSVAAILNNIDTAIAAFCSTVPIGGETGSIPNIVPYDQLIDVIFNANKGTVDLQLLNPSGNLAIAPTAVPVPGTRNPASQVFLV
jgi:hypothetical protein